MIAPSWLSVNTISLSHSGGDESLHTTPIASVAAPLFSTLCDKFGCRKVALVGSFVLSLGVFISAFASSIFFLYFSFGLLAGKSEPAPFVLNILLCDFLMIYF